MIEAVIFDMDGVIIDSEPLWTEAQKEIFISLGVHYDEILAENTKGTNAYDTIDFWFRRQPWQNKSYKEVEELISSRMFRLIEEKGIVIPGIYELIHFFHEKNLKIGLASGSPLFIIHKVLEQIKLYNQFDIIHTADNEEFGKPHPAIFLSAAHMLGVDPRNCIVIEDSFNGLLAAKSARMKGIAYLPDGEFHNTRFDFADLKLSSFYDFKEPQFIYLQNLM
jgi:mannitol-1-/sugar-/sorbitol-6-/2-deoxyglucose-6-phosphatase